MWSTSDFLQTVARRAWLPLDQAAMITHATLETLADRISGGEAEDLADQLPGGLDNHLRKPPDREQAEPFGLGDFVQRVAERAGVDGALAGAGVRAVLTTLGEAVSGDELQDMAAQLPKEFREVIEPVGAGGRQAR